MGDPNDMSWSGATSPAHLFVKDRIPFSNEGGEAMPESALIHRLTVGSVTANVCRHNSPDREYHVVLPRDQFAAEELLMLRDTVKQAERFIGYQEQLALVAR
jgi:hypothetical protein